MVFWGLLALPLDNCTHHFPTHDYVGILKLLKVEEFTLQQLANAAHQGFIFCLFVCLSWGRFERRLLNIHQNSIGNKLVICSDLGVIYKKNHLS